MVNEIAGTEPPLIDLPLMVISCEPLRFITLDAVYGATTGVVATGVVAADVVVTAVVLVDADAPVAGVAAVAGFVVVAVVILVAVVVVLPVAMAGGVVGVVFVVAVFVLPVAGVAVAEDVVAEAVMTGCSGVLGVTIESFLQEVTKKTNAVKNAQESLIRPLEPSAL